MERVTGIGGVFFKAADPERIAAWYADHLGVECSPRGDVVWQDQTGPTVWAPFPADSDYLGASGQQVMINFRVRDLDAMLLQLRTAGVEPDDEVVDAVGVGRFVHLRDPAGTRIELWEPTDRS